MQLMSKDEVEAAQAHEVGHIKHRWRSLRACFKAFKHIFPLFSSVLLVAQIIGNFLRSDDEEQLNERHGLLCDGVRFEIVFGLFSIYYRDVVLHQKIPADASAVPSLRYTRAHGTSAQALERGRPSEGLPSAVPA